MPKKQYAFRKVKKFCETCGKPLTLKTEAHIKRKRFCSQACRMKATNNARKIDWTTVTRKRCRKCKRKRRLKNFYFTGKWPRSKCKDCHKVLTHKLAKSHPEWRHKIEENRIRRRAKQPFGDETVRQCGLTVDEAYAIYNAQGGVCAICGKPPNLHRLALDHDHATGKARQFLCAGCNGALAVLESGAKFQKLKAYLIRHESKSIF